MKTIQLRDNIIFVDKIVYISKSENKIVFHLMDCTKLYFAYVTKKERDKVYDDLLKLLEAM